MKTSLPDYIEKIGDEAAANLFGAEVRTVQSWRRRERYPRPAKARHIIEASGGQIDMAGIYGESGDGRTEPEPAHQPSAAAATERGAAETDGAEAEPAATPSPLMGEAA